MGDEIAGGVRGHGKGAGSDRHVGAGHADEIDHQGDREDRPATAEQPERQPDQRTGEGAEEILDEGEGHGEGLDGRGGRAGAGGR